MSTNANSIYRNCAIEYDEAACIQTRDSLDLNDDAKRRSSITFGVIGQM